MSATRMAVVSLCLVLLALTLGGCDGTPTPTPTATPMPPTDTPTPIVITPTPTPVRAADLSAEKTTVQYRHPGGAVEEMDVGDHEPMGTGDEIKTDESGLGILTFPDFLRVQIFRETGLQVKAAPDPDAPPIVKLYLALGTTIQELQEQAGERVVVTTETDWATITSVATTYLISVDKDGVTSVVVFKGEARVEAQQKTVTLQPGQATFVKPLEAPRPPTDAEMAAVDDWIGSVRAAEEVGSIKPVIFPLATPTPTSTPTATRAPTATPTPKPADTDIIVVQDNLPVVEKVYVEPATVNPGGELKIGLVASDDFGLKSIRWQIAGTEDAYFDQGDEADCGGTTWCELSWSLKWAGNKDGQFTINAQALDTAGQLSSVGSATINVLSPADLIVQSIDRIDVSCVSGSCTTTVVFTVANVGTGPAGAFKVLIRADPAQGQQRELGINGLAAGQTMTLQESLPSGGNCYDPNCTVCITVNSGGQVVESNERNNELCETWFG